MLPFEVFLKCQANQLQVLHISADPGVQVRKGERGAAYFSSDISLPPLQAKVTITQCLLIKSTGQLPSAQDQGRRAGA